MKLNWQADEEFADIIQDLIQTEEVQALDQHTHHYVMTRLDHSLHVAYRSFRLARKFGWNKVAVARAGLLHDLFYYDWRTTKFTEGSHAYMHPRIACANAQKITQLSDLEKDIIIKHMWLATLAFPKYRESYLVSMVDKYCAVVEVLHPWSQKSKRWLGKVAMSLSGFIG